MLLTVAAQVQSQTPNMCSPSELYVGANYSGSTEISDKALSWVHLPWVAHESLDAAAQTAASFKPYVALFL